MLSRGSGNQRFSQKDESLLGSNATSLNDDEVIINNTIVREASQWGDVLFSYIGISGGVVLGSTSGSLSDSVDFLVQFGSVVISALTSSGNTPGNSSGMPSSDTSDFSVTSVRFLLEMSDSPSGNDTLESVTLGDTDHIKYFILTEDVINSDFFLKESLDERNFVSNSFSSVDLDFEDVVLLLSQVFKEVVLSVDDSSN